MSVSLFVAQYLWAENRQLYEIAVVRLSLLSGYNLVENKMKWVLIIAGIAASCLSTLSLADGLENAKKAGCLNCHAVDRKVVGPSYKDVAAKYKDDPGAEAKLIKKVKGGGYGVWGKVMMPANLGKLTDEEYKTTVAWILSLK